jgi:WD40 repeat protein
MCRCVCRSSGDPHARIYDFSAGGEHSKPVILELPEDQRAENKDVTAAEWHPAGNKVVAGSFKGVIRVWHKDGAQHCRL